MIVDVVVAAGGKGRRLGGAVPKQWLSIGDRTIFERSVAACAASPRVRGIVVVVPDGDVDHARTLAAGAAGAKLLDVVAGGARRQDSVAAGVAALPGDADVVLVHDAARPFVTGAIIGRVIDAAAREGAAIAGAPRARHGEARRSRRITLLDRRHDPARRSRARPDAARLPA